MPTVWIETSSGCGGTIPKMVDLDGADEILSDIHQACDMYSYHTPAALYWQGFIAALLQRGLTAGEIIEELCSKGTRHFLDERGMEVVKHGYEDGRDYDLCVTE